MFLLYKPNPDMKKESLNISPSGASGRLISFTGKSGGFSVCTVPSLNVRDMENLIKNLLMI